MHGAPVQLEAGHAQQRCCGTRAAERVPGDPSGVLPSAWRSLAAESAPSPFACLQRAQASDHTILHYSPVVLKHANPAAEQHIVGAGAMAARLLPRRPARKVEQRHIPFPQCRPRGQAAVDSRTAWTARRQWAAGLLQGAGSGGQQVRQAAQEDRCAALASSWCGPHLGTGVSEAGGRRCGARPLPAVGAEGRAGPPASLSPRRPAAAGQRPRPGRSASPSCCHRCCWVSPTWARVGSVRAQEL